MARTYEKPDKADPKRFFLSCSTAKEDKCDDDYPKILELYKYLTHQRNKRDWSTRKELSACLWDMSTSPPLLLECNFENHQSIQPNLSIQNDETTTDGFEPQTPERY